MALPESEPKLIAEMLKTLAEYGIARSGPITTRKSCEAISVGQTEWLIHSWSFA